MFGRRLLRTIECLRDASTRGTAAIEFALAAPVFVILLSGVVELGFGIYQDMQVQDAAEAGALYAGKHGLDSAGISAAVLSATGAANITASPAPLQYCGCPTATGITAATCGVTCASGSPAGNYIRVNASATRLSILPTSSLGLPATLVGRADVRTQ